MKKSFFVILLGMLISVIGCQKQYLVGYYDKDEFLQACEWKTKVNDKYKPKAQYMDSIAGIRDSAKVKLFLGTFCPDSKRLVPKFFAILPDLPVSDLQIISVDTTKKDERGMAQTVGLKKIPTFIIYNDEQEVGRIVERSRGRLEKRLFYIFKKL